MAKKRGPRNKNPRFLPKVGLLRRDFEWPLISKKVAAYFDYYIISILAQLTVVGGMTGAASVTGRSI